MPFNEIHLRNWRWVVLPVTILTFLGLVTSTGAQTLSRGSSNVPSLINGTGRTVIGKLLVPSTLTMKSNLQAAVTFYPHDAVGSSFGGPIAPDGTFRVENVRGGAWWLLATFTRMPTNAGIGLYVAFAGKTVVVPESAGVHGNEPLDIGTMETVMVHSPQIGETAALFEVKTTNFGDFKLADHRGQYVFLDFEIVCDGWNKEPPWSVWASFGTDDRLAMLTVWLPQWGFGGFGPGKMEYQWPVARLDQAEWYENEQMPIRAGYGLPVNRYDPAETNLSCSCFFLVGPDGKIVARDTIAGDRNGAKIKAAIAEALGKK